LALVVAITRYADTSLRQLRAPARDAVELRDLLADPQVGGFAVTLDRPGFDGGCVSTRPCVCWPLIDSCPLFLDSPTVAPERGGVNLERPEAEPLAAEPRTNEVDAEVRRRMLGGLEEQRGCHAAGSVVVRLR
jgi:hypothetical protein